MTCYAAPAARPLTVLHTVDVPTVPGANGPVEVPDAVTACCGQPMDPADLWTAVDPQPGDRVCPGATTQEGIF